MTEPRLISGKDAAAYCGVTPVTWSKWVAMGLMPKPLSGTRRWDKKAIDLALDKASGIVTPTAAAEDEYTKWKQSYVARKMAEKAAEDAWEREYAARKGAAGLGCRKKKR